MLIITRRILLFLFIVVIFNIMIQLLFRKDSANDDSLQMRILNQEFQPKRINSKWKLLERTIVKENKTSPVSSFKLNPKVFDESPMKPKKNKNEKYKNKPLCPLIPPKLGPVEEDLYLMNLHGIDNMILRVLAGGIYIPKQCIARQDVAIITAVHDTRPEIRNFIGTFLYYMHPFLMKQQLEYQIFIIVKRNAQPPYKRGELFNVGFEVAQNYNEYFDCVIFQDIHLVPIDTRNLYRCSEQPKKLIDYDKPSTFGGIIAIKPSTFALVNGFSNSVYYNNDDYKDLYERLIAANITIETNVTSAANYTEIDYLKQVNDNYLPLPAPSSKSIRSRHLKDGLSDILLKTRKIELRQLYTLVEVENA